jgi:hypothetical protein
VYAQTAQPIIEVAWRQAGEENKIYYRAPGR